MTSSARAKAMVLLAALPIVLSVGCERKNAGGAAAGGGMHEMPPPVVTITNAKAQDVPVYVDGIGKAVAAEAVVIMPRVSGEIVKRHIQDGAEVKAGDMLFSLDARPFEAALQSAQAQLAQASAGLEYAKIELERYTSIAGTKAVSKSDIDSRRNATLVAEALVAAAKAQLRTAELNLEYCSIRSPIDGRASSRMVDAGNMVKSNETPLLSIQKLDPIYVDFTVNEDQLAAVRENMAHGTLKTFVRLSTDAEPGRVGALTFLDNSVKEGSGTIRLRATLSNADQHFWPGQFANVRLVLRTHQGAVLVPAPAAQLGQQGPYVLVVKEDMTAEIRPIVPGQPQGDWIVIEKGVSNGEKVIVDGQLMVRPGGKVAPAPEGPPPGIAAAGAPAAAEPASTEIKAPATAPAAKTPATQGGDK